MVGFAFEFVQLAFQRPRQLGADSQLDRQIRLLNSSPAEKPAIKIAMLRNRGLLRFARNWGVVLARAL